MGVFLDGSDATEPYLFKVLDVVWKLWRFGVRTSKRFFIWAKEYQ
jgi:hypothetical protein